MLVINSGPIFTVSETSGDIRRKPQFFVPLYLMPPWVCYRRNSVTQFRLRKRQWWTYRVMKKVWWQVRPVRHNTIAWRTGGRTNISLLSGTWVMLTREKLIDVLNSICRNVAKRLAILKAPNSVQFCRWNYSVLDNAFDRYMHTAVPV